MKTKRKVRRKKQKTKKKEKNDKFKSVLMSFINKIKGSNARAKRNEGVERSFLKKLTSDASSIEKNEKREDIGRILEKEESSSSEKDSEESNEIKLNVNEELRKFSLKYELAVESLVLLKLPSTVIQSDALKSLRNKFQRKSPDSKIRDSVAGEKSNLEPEFFFYQGSDSEENFVSPEIRPRFPFHFFSFGSLTDKLYSDVELNDCPFNENGDVQTPRGIEFEIKNLKNSDVATPPIQFYRRNMF